MDKKKTIEEITNGGISSMFNPDNIEASFNYINERNKFLEWFNQSDDKTWEDYFYKIINSIYSNRIKLSDDYVKRTFSNLRRDYIEVDEEIYLKFKSKIVDQRIKDQSLYKSATNEIKESKHSKEYFRKVAVKIVSLCRSMCQTETIIKVKQFELQTKEFIVIETIFNKIKKNSLKIQNTSKIHNHKMEPYENYIIGSEITKLEEITNEYFPDLEINTPILLGAFLKKRGKMKVTINFSKSCTTKHAGEFLNRLHQIHPKKYKKDFLEDISRRIEFISSGYKGKPAQEKTLSNWMSIK